MSGVHDMGGMEGFGPIVPGANEPVFHHRWEARALALTLAVGAWGRWTLDQSRHALAGHGATLDQPGICEPAGRGKRAANFCKVAPGLHDDERV